jgi:hypothetical protein
MKYLVYLALNGYHPGFSAVLYRLISCAWPVIRPYEVHMWKTLPVCILQYSCHAQNSPKMVEASRKANIDLKRELDEEKRKYVQLHREKVYSCQLTSPLNDMQLQEIQSLKENFLRDKKQEVAELKSRLKIEHSIELDNLRKDLIREKELEVRTAVKKVEDRFNLSLDKEKVCLLGWLY